MVMNICEVCGKEFETSRPAKYCSEDCKTKSNRKARNARRRASRKVSKVCPICGTEFKGTSNDKYCSNECYELSHLRMVKSNRFERNSISIDTARSIQEVNPNVQLGTDTNGNLIELYGSSECESDIYSIESKWAKYAKMEEDIKSSNHH